MTDEITEPYQRVRDAILDSAGLVRAVASGRQRGTAPSYRRVELRYVDLKSGRRLQLTSYDATQAFTKNVEPGGDAEIAIDAVLRAGYANWHVETTTETLQVRVTKKGRPLLHAARRESSDGVQPDGSHDRAKSRRLEAGDRLFVTLGIASEQGVVKPSRMAKFRQVQDLLAALDPLIDEAVALGPGEALSVERPLRIVDLGCGNAYLTFAAHRYLTSVRGLPVALTGVDSKAQALEHNSDIARRLGVSDAVQFVQGSIADVTLADPPDLVLALHACDTATDDALARAVEWQAPVVVAAPCCHHDIAKQLAHKSIDSPYRLIARHGILRERLADVLTDSLRAALLRIAGYRVEVIEFVDSRHTPRNALIRAVRTGAPAAAETTAAYRELTAQWEVTPALQVRLCEADADLRATLA